MRRAGRNTVVLLPLTTGPADEQSAPRRSACSAFSFAEQRELTDSELRVVRLLGQQAGQALDRARLYDDARRREEPGHLPGRDHPRAGRDAPAAAAGPPAGRPGGAGDRRLGRGPAAGRPGRPARRRRRPGARPRPAGRRDRRGRPPAASRTSPSRRRPAPGCAVLPLTARGRVLGTLALRMAPDRRRRGRRAVFLADLADRAGLALENARLYEQERPIARTLQRSLLAGDLPSATPGSRWRPTTRPPRRTSRSAATGSTPS